jgi:hypothetical protein
MDLLKYALHLNICIIRVTSKTTLLTPLHINMAKLIVIVGITGVQVGHFLQLKSTVGCDELTAKRAAQ